MRFKRYLSLQEELKIVKKSWKLKSDKYKVEINDDVDKHNLISRVQSRTDLKLNQLQGKMQKGIDYLANKDDFFKQDKNFIALKYKKSNFTMLTLLRKDTNYMRVSSIFDNEMPIENALNWDINEFNNEFKDDIDIKLSSIYKSAGSPIDLNKGDLMFLMEINEEKLTKDIYVMDPNDVKIIEIEE